MMPISYTRVLSAKMIVFMIVCIVQFALMMLIGLWLLPLLGTPTLNLGQNIPGLLLVVLSAAFAASGFGIMVGTLATSHEQASTFSAVSIILAAAIGGVMVPVYLMPAFMQQVSLYSPLAWGLNAFLGIFVRGSGFFYLGFAPFEPVAIPFKLPKAPFGAFLLRGLLYFYTLGA